MEKENDDCTKKINELVATINQFLQEVDDDLVSWYQLKSKKPRMIYKIVSFFILTLGVATPVIIVYSSIIGIITSTFTAILSVLAQHFRWGKIWFDFKQAQFSLQDLIRRTKNEVFIIQIEPIPCEDKFIKMLTYFKNIIREVDSIHKKEISSYFEVFGDPDSLLRDLKKISKNNETQK